MNSGLVLYCDERLAIVNKPADIVVHDSKLARGEGVYFADTLREQFQRPIFLIHRLDRATSGCLLIAFDRDTAAILGEQFMSRSVEKTYLAVCRGWPVPASGVIDHPLDGGPGKPEKKPAITDYQTLASGEWDEPAAGFASSRYALLACTPRTGRFRQIRRHLKHIDHHLIGDSSHGDGRRNRQFRMRGVHRMLLHAQRLRFVHPHSGQLLDISAPLDAAFTKALELFGWSCSDALKNKFISANQCMRDE